MQIVTWKIKGRNTKNPYKILFNLKTWFKQNVISWWLIPFKFLCLFCLLRCLCQCICKSKCNMLHSVCLAPYYYAHPLSTLLYAEMTCGALNITIMSLCQHSCIKHCELVRGQISTGTTPHCLTKSLQKKCTWAVYKWLFAELWNAA